ncbi:hypothetical protein IJI31_05865 [bacterium]|nr:hypothetical protein [bacterium]
MTILETFNVKFENLIFSRSGYNLIIKDNVDPGFVTRTYPDFFNTQTIPSPHINDGVRAYDNNGELQTYTFNNEIKINISATTQWFYGMDYNEIISADAAIVLSGGAGNDTFISKSGNFSQIFQGDAGNDIYYSGQGTDTFIGGIGVDTYVFRKNDGNDGILEYGSSDIIRFIDVAWNELTFTNCDNNLHITYGDSSVTVNNFFNPDGTIRNNVLDTVYTSEVELPHSIADEANIKKAFFTSKYFNNLNFTRNGNDLTISTISGDVELVTYTNYFNTVSHIETVTALNDEGIYQTYSILKDTEIHVTPTTATYTGTNYNEYIVSTETSEKISGGAGNDIIISNSTENNPLTVEGNTGNDKLVAGAGDDTFVFSSGDGHDILYNSNINDTIVFSNVTKNDLTFTKVDTSLVIGYDHDSLTITDFYDEDGFLRDNVIDVLYAYGSAEPISIQDNAFWGKTYRASDAVNGKIIGTIGDDRVIASDYIASFNKGLTINTYSGNDHILGTNYNDTIISGAGNNVVKEVAGKNKITTGSGADTITLTGYSINTVDAGLGDNTINVKSMGTNKITAGRNNDTLNLYYGNNNANLGAGDNNVLVDDLGINKVSCGNGYDTVKINAGYNTINVGNGNNSFTITNGINTLTSGKNYDAFYIYGGNNTINSGAGNDEFYIYNENPVGEEVDGGYNTINSGNGNNKFVIDAGNNIIKSGNGRNHFTVNNGINYITSGSGNDTFLLNGGNNSVIGGSGDDLYVTNGKASFVDSKGNDTYDLSAIVNYNNVLVSISDYAGANSYIFNNDILNKNVLFSVNIAKKPKLDDVGNYIYTLGKNITMTTLDENGKYTTGVDIIGLANMSKINVGGNTYRLYVDAVAQSIANWLGAKGFTSTDAVFDKGSDTDVAALLGFYNAHTAQDYFLHANA